MLLDGELDALMSPEVPAQFYERVGKIVRLFPNFRKEEQEYFRRTRLYPAFHIIAFRREVFLRVPLAARSIYLALIASKEHWYKNLRILPEMTTPWLLNDIEEAQELIGQDWNPSGISANREMIAIFCEELFAQGIIDQPIDGKTVFADFEEMMDG
jgi:4,5-dihydroxyphthalate decarboxylase